MEFLFFDIFCIILIAGEIILFREVRKIKRQIGLGVAVKTVVVFGTPNKT